MFKLFYKPLCELVEVYSVKNDKNGYPHFLIFIKNQWRYISAKHFVTTTR